MQEKDARSLTQRGQAELRQRAVEMRLAGKSRATVAAELGVHLKTVTRWSSEHKKHGAAVFGVSKRGRRLGQLRRLSAAQEQALRRMIMEKTPDQCGLNAWLWTREILRRLIERQCEIAMPGRTCGEYLQRWGLVPRRAMAAASDALPAGRPSWMEQTYPSIASVARRLEAKVCWFSYSRVPCLDHTFEPGEVQAEAPAPAGSFYMLCAATNQGKLHWLITGEALAAEMLVRFLEALVAQMPCKVLLVVERLDIHDSALLRSWLLENRDVLDLYYLPAQSTAASWAGDFGPSRQWAHG